MRKWDPGGATPPGEGGGSTLPPSGTRVPHIPPDLPTPRRIGRYDIKGIVGQGGYGIVYQGVHRWLKVPGAVKVMRHVLALERRPNFLREARRLALLRGHPAIAEVRDFGFYHEPESDANLPYFVMDLVPGGKSIADYADANNLDQTARLGLFVRACDGARYAHDLDIVHLDLKPANILVWPPARGRPAQPKIIDFGIARAADPGREIETHRGVSGTIPYMSPEQTDPQSVLDKRSDVYSLGVVLYELLCRHLPIDTRGRTSEQAINAIRFNEPDFDSRGPRNLPKSLQFVLRKALSKSPGDRQQDAGELLRDVTACLRGEVPPGSEPGSLVRAAYAARLLVTRHPVYTALVIGLLTIAATQWIAVPALYSWIDTTGWFMARFSRPGFAAFEKVVMIERTPATDAVVRFDPARPTAFREHYVTLMTRLAEMRPRAVVFDLMFRADDTYAKEFADAARGLREKGIPVIVGVKSGELDEQGYPPRELLNPTIREGISSWGEILVGPGYPWKIALASLREGPRAVESLAMATIAAIEAVRADPRAPESLSPDYTFDLTRDRLCLAFHRLGTRPGARPRALLSPQHMSYRVTGVRLVPSSEPKRLGPRGEHADDLVAWMIVRPPPLRVFRAATFGLECFLGDKPDEVAMRRCTGVVVLVHHPAGDVDKPYHPAEPFAGGQVHAAAIETLMRGTILRWPDYYREWAILIFGAALGLALPIPLTRRRSWWPAWAVWGSVGAWTAAVAGVLIAAIAGALLLNYIVNPLVVVFSMVVAAGLSLAVARVCRFQIQPVEAA